MKSIPFNSEKDLAPVVFDTKICRLANELKELGIPVKVQELPDSTRTAKEAAAAANCQVGQIVKSLVFQITGTKEPILILTSGSNMVDENLVGDQIGEKIQFAPADFVRDETGFAIGGVSPYGLIKEVPIYIDQDLLNYSEIWAAAGSHHAVFCIQPEILVETTGARVLQVA